MRIIDADGIDIDEPDMALGQLVCETIVIESHPAVPEVEEVREEVLVWPEPGMPEWDDRDDDGNLLAALYREEVVREWQPAQDAWDETEDVLRYVPYTEEELAEIARAEAEAEEARKRAEEEAARRAELDAWLAGAPEQAADLDEAVVELYEAQTRTQLDTDEALTALYETILSMNGGD